MKRNKKKSAMLQALRNTLGNVTMACKASNIARQTHYEWLYTDPEYKSEVDSILDEQGDFVENKLLQAIKDGDTTAIIFYCKTKLKSRGYTEKQEVDMNADIIIDCHET